MEDYFFTKSSIVLVIVESRCNRITSSFGSKSAPQKARRSSFNLIFKSIKNIQNTVKFYIKYRMYHTFRCCEIIRIGRYHFSNRTGVFWNEWVGGWSGTVENRAEIDRWFGVGFHFICWPWGFCYRRLVICRKMNCILKYSIFLRAVRGQTGGLWFS